jgi:hypothetical protein
VNTQGRIPSSQLPSRILLRQQRRGEVEVQLVVAVELLRGCAFEIAAGVQARHFVLVLVGHQLEAVACDRLRQAGEARCLLLLDVAHLLDQRLVAPRRPRSGTR